MKSICSGWEFTSSPTEDFLSGKDNGAGYAVVRLPHTVAETPLHYASPEQYTGVFGYRKSISIEDIDKRYFVRFDGAAHAAELFVNGRPAGEHYCGYTAFKAEITEFVHEGENVIAVRLDTNERKDVPPFGFVMDYLGYGGLYREAWLETEERVFIEDIFAYGDEKGLLRGSLTSRGEYAKALCRVTDGETSIFEFECSRGKIEEGVPGVRPWSPESPKLYYLEAVIFDSEGRELDKKRIRFGFRRAEFKADGFYLNGKKYFMRGLDRHQCWPYIGYAAPASLQREDARILKEELAVNAVRTSHYPQSQSFIDACDELGLLVFTEIPGWQHIGDEAWKDRSVENVREMVLQNRNHPSIILWGVRINESRDDDGFYSRTNAAAHELDPSRATSGVRFIKKSSLLEDVYAYNDFSHSGGNAGCLKKKDVTPDEEKALLISEHNGHMFPTKAFDNAPRRQEHALRHAKVLEAAYGSGEHAGCFGWCMFDYATHRDFGSGDRICYHGVMDSFRNPKLAALLYASQGDEKPVIELSSPMDIGDYNASFIGPVYIFTNADEVDLYRNGEFVTTFRPKKSALPHPPIEMDDPVGELLKTREGMTGPKEKLVHECLAAAARYGMDALPLKYKLKMGECMLRYGLTYEQGYELYGKYVGNWGGTVTSWRLDAKKGGDIVGSITRGGSGKLKLEAKASSLTL
ncbi:MAG: glycoside hydrolase family 2 protein, partial [Clostridia bacterium]|nr:glycoside hydrolase family 2 protein [Clostridia bacterium]